MQEYQFQTMLLKHIHFMTKPGLKLMEHLFMIVFD